jgi:hypothetical protein
MFGEGVGSVAAAAANDLTLTDATDRYRAAAAVRFGGIWLVCAKKGTGPRFPWRRPS